MRTFRTKNHVAFNTLLRQGFDLIQQVEQQRDQSAEVRGQKTPAGLAMAKRLDAQADEADRAVNVICDVIGTLQEKDASIPRDDDTLQLGAKRAKLAEIVERIEGLESTIANLAEDTLGLAEQRAHLSSLKQLARDYEHAIRATEAEYQATPPDRFWAGALDA